MPAFVTRLTTGWPGVLDGGQRGRVGAARGATERRRWVSLERRVWPLAVVHLAERGEGPLLGAQRAAGRADNLGLERPMHPFVRPVLPGRGGEDALMLNAQPQPPDVELGDPVDPSGGEGDAVVGTNGARQPVLAVRRPEIIGGRGRRRDDPGMEMAPPPAALLYQAAAGQQIAGGADRGQRDLVRPRRLRGLHPRGGFELESAAVARTAGTVALAAEAQSR